MTQLEITETIARKVLATVDAGLVSGLGNAKPGQMCVEAAVCYALGLPHGDDPACVSYALRSLKIRLNDSAWSSSKARAKGLRRLALAQLGSRDAIDDRKFVRHVAILAIRVSVPSALRTAASIHKDPKYQKALRDTANKCEREATKKNASEAREIAASAAAAAYAAYAVAAASDAASAAAAAYAAYAASAAASAAVAADAYAVYAGAYAASASAAASDAASAAAASDAITRDKLLADFAERVVQILIQMKAPGCKWLSLTEAA